jgi:hypothetical protein
MKLPYPDKPIEPSEPSKPIKPTKPSKYISDLTTYKIYMYGLYFTGTRLSDLSNCIRAAFLRDNYTDKIIFKNKHKDAKEHLIDELIATDNIELSISFCDELDRDAVEVILHLNENIIKNHIDCIKCNNYWSKLSLYRRDIKKYKQLLIDYTDASSKYKKQINEYNNKINEWKEECVKIKKMNREIKRLEKTIL